MVVQRRCLVALAALVLALPAAAAAQTDGWDRRNDQVHIRIGSNYTLPDGATLHGPLLVIGGTARLDGMTEDDVTVLGGAIQVGPTAVIRGDLNAIGATVDLAEGAQITGDIERTMPDLATLRAEIGALGGQFWAWLGAWLTILRLSFAFVAGLLLAAVAPFWLRSIGGSISAAPGWSLVAGAATELLITPAVMALSIALVITIVGIPLLAGIPVLLAVMAVLWLAGFTAVAVRVGAALLRQRTEAPVRQFVAGFVAIGALTVVAQILLVAPRMGNLAVLLGAVGLAVEYVAWTLGLGAALLTAVNRSGRVVPPPLPPEAAPQYVR